jgi:hypothetical protein
LLVIRSQNRTALEPFQLAHIDHAIGQGGDALEQA